MDGTKYHAIHNMCLDQCLTYVPGEAWVHSLKLSKVFTEWVFLVLEQAKQVVLLNIFSL